MSESTSQPITHIRVMDKPKRVPISEVLRIEGDGPYSIIVTRTRTFLMAVTLHRYQQMPGMIRVHKSFVVNSLHCQALEYKKRTECWITQSDGQQIQVSKHRLRGLPLRSDLTAVLAHCQQKPYVRRGDRYN